MWLLIFLLGQTGGFAQSDNTQISGYVKNVEEGQPPVSLSLF